VLISWALGGTMSCTPPQSQATAAKTRNRGPGQSLSRPQLLSWRQPFCPSASPPSALCSQLGGGGTALAAKPAPSPEKAKSMGLTNCLWLHANFP
jgi:hypothetical protein